MKKKEYIIVAGRDGRLKKTFRTKKSAENYKKKKGISGMVVTKYK